MSFDPISRAGRLEVICGPMFSGKTEELLRRFRAVSSAHLRVALVYPIVGERGGSGVVISHSGDRERAIAIERAEEILMVAAKSNVICVDEAQFLGKEFIAVVGALVRDRKHVVVAGLDLDYRRHAFGSMPELVSIADAVTQLRAVCGRCGAPAEFTSRRTDVGGQVVMVGSGELYEARCGDCFDV